MTAYEYISKLEDILDDACSALSPVEFEKVLDSLSMIIAGYE